jgi:hypothetical protein
MPRKAHTKLADALERATKVARRQILQTSSIIRADREYLVDRGYLQEIVKGWYLLGRPSDKASLKTADSGVGRFCD